MLRRFILALSLAFSIPASAAPALRLLVQEGSSSSGEAEYSTKKYQPLASLLSTYLKREVQVSGLSPARSYDAETLRQGDILIIRPNTVAGLAIQNLGFQTVVGLDSGVKAQVLFVGPASLKKAFKSPEELKKLRFAMPPANSEVSREALRMLGGFGVKSDAVTVYNVSLLGTIPFALENKLADVGVIRSDATVAAKLSSGNYTILAEGEKMAPWAMLASAKLGNEQLDQLRLAMKSMMSNPEQKAALQAMRIQNVVDVDAQTYVGAYRRYSAK